MKNYFLLLFASMMLFVSIPGNATAKPLTEFQQKRPADGQPKTQRVKGYTKKNGTYVAPYSRRRAKR